MEMKIFPSLSSKCFGFCLIGYCFVLREWESTTGKSSFTFSVLLIILYTSSTIPSFVPSQKSLFIQRTSWTEHIALGEKDAEIWSQRDYRHKPIFRDWNILFAVNQAVDVYWAGSCILLQDA